MNNETLARYALNEVIALTGSRKSNVGLDPTFRDSQEYKNMSPKERAKVDQRVDKVWAFNKLLGSVSDAPQPPFNAGPVDDHSLNEWVRILRYNYQMSKRGVANCSQCAGLAYISIQDQLEGQRRSDRPNVDIVKLAPPGDHLFVVIGEKWPTEKREFEIGPNRRRQTYCVYPRKFAGTESGAGWSEDAWIVDPWIHVACRAREYPIQWYKAMIKWNRWRRQIYTDVTAAVNELGTWVPASSWRFVVTRYHKLSLTFPTEGARFSV
jgi:hypothetical protein